MKIQIAFRRDSSEKAHRSLERRGYNTTVINPFVLLVEENDLSEIMEWLDKRGYSYDIV